MQENTKNFNLILENKNYLKLSGVEGVINLTETDASVIVCGQVLEIKGLNLKAEKLSVETGDLCISGIINSLKFEEKREKKGLLKRIFK